MYGTSERMEGGGEMDARAVQRDINWINIQTTILENFAMLLLVSEEWN
jgi:hypothetical protein